MGKDNKFTPGLVDVERRADRYKSFAIPSREEREDLWPGDLAKVILDGVGERLWVRVIDVLTGCVYVGSLESSPLCIGTQKGDELVFRPEHVADIMRKRIPGFDRQVEKRKLGTKALLQ